MIEVYIWTIIKITKDLHLNANADVPHTVITVVLNANTVQTVSAPNAKSSTNLEDTINGTFL